MTTSDLYHTIRTALARQLPAVPASQHTSLALVMTGLARSQSGHLAKIARNLPLATQQASKEQRVRRLLQNPRITAEQHYQPIVKRVIAGMVRQPVHLILDRVLLHDRHNLLVVGLACRRRVIPLVWQVLPHDGSSALADQQALLQAALALLPTGVRVTVHADSEFRSQALVAWLRAQQHDVFIGLRGQTLVADTRQGPAEPLQTRVRPEDGIVYLNGVYLTKEREGPVNVYAWWSKDDRGQPILRAVQTNLSATPHTYRVGKRRMWVEPTFRELEGGGFGLDTTGLIHAERLERLLIPLLLCYVWLCCLGRWVIKRGWRRWVDGRPPRVRAGQWGLFQRGVTWLQRAMSLDHPSPPVMFYMHT